MLRRIRCRTWLLAIAIAGALFVVVTCRLFAWPSAVPVDQVQRADAVVMFAGGTGERLDAVFALMERDVADTLVLPNGTIPGWIRGNRLCAGDESVVYEVICPSPEPDNTRGEAAGVAAIAADRGWDSLVSVTSSYHVVRADIRLQRCFDGEIQRVAAGPNRSRGAWLSLVVHEWLGVGQALLLQRDC